MSHSLLNHNNEWLTCFVCEGARTLYNENEHDFYEGWKMAGKHPCDFCHGKGKIEKGDVRYFAVMAYRNQLVKQTKIKDLIQGIKQKLTKEELALIKFRDED